MRTNMRAAVCLIACALSSVSVAGTKNNFITPEARTVEGGREVLIIVGQSEIAPNINISNITAAAGGGLLFALIDSGVNNARAKEAEKTIVPLREALLGFDFDPMAQGASSATLAGTSWLDMKQLRLTKDASAPALVAALDGATTSQIMVLRYEYETNAEFSAMVVSLDAQLVNKAVPKGKKPDARLQNKYLPFHQVLRSMVRLPNANDKDPAGNVKAWSADGGRAARAAVELGLQRCQELLQRSLALTEAEFTAIMKRNKRPRSTIPNVIGWELESPQPGSTLVHDVMTGGFVQVEVLDASPPAVVQPTASATPEAPVLAPAQ